MSHKSKKTLTEQVDDRLKSKIRFGQSKHADKDGGEHKKYIYSFGAYHDYTQACYKFVKYCRENRNCKTLQQCRDYINEWLSYLIDRGYSASTISKYKCAVAKLYGESSKNYIATPPRYRKDITRSRGVKIRDAHFSETNHAAIVALCRSCGVRRRELCKLRGEDLVFENGEYFVNIKFGKGGKHRLSKVIGDVENVKAIFDAVDPKEKIFKKVPNGMDVHGYRREYTQAYYDLIARPVDEIPKNEKYICRKDKKGTVYDKKAMLEVSRMLGHNRIDVIAGHYLD